jgi:hypothetical protein
VLSLLLKRGFSRGLVGGSRPWLLAGTGALVVKGLRWAAQRPTVVVYREEIRPGETLVLTREEEHPSRRQRREEAKQAKAARKRARADAD